VRIAHDEGKEPQTAVAMTKAKVHGLTIVLSVGVHAALTAVLSFVAIRSIAAQPTQASPPTPPGTGALSVELPAAGLGLAADEQVIDTTGDPPRITAGQDVARLDTNSAGRGGMASVRDPALNLADRDERMRQSPDLMDRLDRDQLQRLRAARVRTSWEDRRSTTHPAELTLVVTGTGNVLERRPESRTDPSRGALASPQPKVSGAAPGAMVDGVDGDRGAEGTRAGSRESAPGAGLAEGNPGHDHRTSAPVASARPAVVFGPVAVPAALRALPKDDVDGEQEVATTVRSLVHASSAGGLAGEGTGGSDGSGEAGAGGAAGQGSHATPLGAGAGDVFDYWTSDPRLVPYFRRIHAKIDPLWADAFPRSALFDLKQGTVILDFTVYADGRAVVSWPPVRPSGIDEFDRNCADAIRRAAPFPPIPRQLGVSELHIRAPFVANNPVVK
jgi:TonB family protein